MFRKENQETSMNLPVATHIDRLAGMIAEMKGEVEAAEKDLHVLRGGIAQLSFVNKESDQDLNIFLVESISALRGRWADDWEESTKELAESKKKVQKIWEEQEDVELRREEIEERVGVVEEMVGIGNLSV